MFETKTLTFWSILSHIIRQEMEIHFPHARKNPRICLQIFQLLNPENIFLFPCKLNGI